MEPDRIVDLGGTAVAWSDWHGVRPRWDLGLMCHNSILLGIVTTDISHSMFFLLSSEKSLI